MYIPHLSLSRPQLYHHRNITKLSHPSLSLFAIIISSHWVQHTPSTAYTEYSIHRVQHTPSTAYTEYSIHQVQHTPSTAYTEYSIHRVQHTPEIVCRPSILMISSWPLNVASACGVPPYRSTATSQFSIRPSKVKSPHHIPTFPSSLTDEWSPSTWRASLQPPPDQPAPSTPPISHDHSLLHVHLETCSITTLECISEFSWSRSPIASPNSLDHSLKVHLWVHSTSAPKCFSKLARSRPQSACPNSLDHSLQLHVQTRLITASKCISNLAQSWPPSASPHSLDHCLPVHLQTQSITAFKCLSVFTAFRPHSASLNSIKYSLDHGLPVHLWVHSISICNCISRLARSLTRSIFVSSLNRYFQSHLELLPSTACSLSRYTVCRWVAI